MICTRCTVNNTLVQNFIFVLFSGCEGGSKSPDEKKTIVDEGLRSDNNRGHTSPSVMEEATNESYLQVCVIRILSISSRSPSDKRSL